MKRRNYLKPALCLILSCCILWVQCCTFGGFVIGGSIRKKESVVPVNFTNIQIGAMVEIQTLEGDIIKGEYRGLGVMPQDEYEKQYKTCKEQQLVNPILTELGDSVTVHLISGEEIHSVLEGFGLISIENKFEYTLIVKKMNAIKTSNYNIKTLSGISTAQGEFIDKDQLQVSIDCYDIPVKSCINLKNKDGLQYIAFNEIFQINETIVKRNTTGAIVGLLVGAAVDITVIGALIAGSWLKGFGEASAIATEEFIGALLEE